MAEQTIDRLSIEIDAKAEQASNSVDHVIKKIEKLKSAFADGIGDTDRIIESINRMREAFTGAGSTGDGLSKLVQSIQELQKLGTQGIAENFRELSNAMKEFSGFDDIAAPMKEFGYGVSQMAAGFKALQNSDVERIRKQFEELTAALRPFIEEMAEAGGGVINFGSQMKAFSDSMRSVSNMKVQMSKQTMLSRTGTGGGIFGGIGKMFKSINLASTVYLLKNVASAVKSATQKIGGYVSSMSDYIENVNLFTVSMGSFTDQATEFTNRIQSDLGFDSGEAMRYMGVFQQLSTSFGVSSDRAYVLSKNLTQLGYDFASFFNLKTEDAFQKLQSGISGEIEPLRRLGIDISTTRLQQELYTLGINKSVESLSQADKETLRYIAIMKQAGNVAGDTARSITSPANALRMLQAQLDITARQIGSIFIPMLNKVIPYLTAFAKIIGDVAARIAAFFGFEMPTFEVPKNDLPAVSEDLEQVGQEAQKTAKKMNFLIGGFDELNRLEEKQESTAADLGTGNILGDIPLPEYDIFEGLEKSNVDALVDKITDAFKRLKDTLMDLGLREVIDNFKDFFSAIGNQIKQYDFATAIKEALLNGFELAMSLINLGQKIVFPIAVALDIPGIVYEAINTLSALFAALNDAVRAVTPGIEEFVQRGLVPIAEWFGDKIRDALQFLQEQLYKVGDWFTDHTDMFTDLGIALGDLTNALWEVIKPILDSAWESFKDVVSKLLDGVLDLTAALIKKLTPILKKTADWIKKNQRPLTNILDAVVKGFIAMKAAEKASKWVKGLKAEIEIFTTTAGKTNSIFDTMVRVFKDTGSGFSAIHAGAIKAASSIKEFVNNLTPMQKTIGTITALTVEFTVVSSAVKDFTNGTSSLSELLIQIIPTIGLVGIALSAMLGPVGWVVAAIGGLAAAVVGYDNALSDANRQMEESILYSDAGVKITDISNAFSQMTDEIIKSNQPILDLSDSINLGKESVSKTSEEISFLIKAIHDGAYTAEEKLPEIQKHFESLYENTSQILDNTYNSIVRALSGSIGDALSQMGVDVPKANAILGNVLATAKGNLETYQAEINQIFDKIREGSATMADYNRLEELNHAVSDLTIETDKNLTQFNETLKDVMDRDIDFSNYQTAFSDLDTSASRAIDSVQETFLELQNQIETMKQWVPEGSEEWNILEKIAEANRNNRDSQIAAITGELNGALDQVQTSLNQKITEMVPRSEATFKDFLMVVFNPDMDIDKIIEERLKRDVGGPIQAQLDELRQKFPADMREIAENGAAGFAGGLDTSIVQQATANMVSSVIGEANKGFEINSPSKVFKRIGEYNMEGLNEGMSSNWNSISKIFSDGITGIENNFNSAWQNVVGKTDESLAFMNTTSESQMGTFNSQWGNNWMTAEDTMKVQMELMKQVTEASFNQLQMLRSGFQSVFQSTWSTGMNEIKRAADTSFIGIKNFAQNAFADIQRWASNMISRVRDGISALKDLVSQQKKVQENSGYASGILNVDRDSINNLRPRAARVPALAGGGVIRKPTYALVGEYAGASSNPEIVAPESTIEESVVAANGELASAMLQMTQMMIAAFREGQNVTLQIDGKEVGKASAKYMRDEERRTGKNPGRL